MSQRHHLNIGNAAPTMHRRTAAWSLAILLCLSSFAAPARSADPSALRKRIDKLFSAKALGRTVVAARVVEAKTGKVLYSFRAGEPMTPASVMKLVTTAAAIDGLGAEWKFHTHVGMLRDDLVVIGGGDPDFSARSYKGDPAGAFRQWARALRKEKITRIKGSLILDDSAFEPAAFHPNWPRDQREYWYEAPVGALALNDNCIDITVAPGKKAGKDARISLSPPTGYFQITGRITTTDIRKKHRYSLQRLAGKPVIKVSGKVWAKAGPVRYYRTVEDPTAFFGAVLKETFAAEGITIAGPVIRRRILNDRGKAPKGFRPVVVHTTPLLRAATVANKRSQGLYAGCIFKALAAYGGGPRGSKWPLRQGSWNAGREAVGRFNAKARLPDDGCVFDDGSGLSRKNRLTATYITELLRMMHKVHGKRWLDTLSVAGRDGTLRNRMRNTEAEGRVFGKTGYIAGVSAIAGYARSRSGGADNPLVFAIFMNRTKSLWQARKAQDAVCKALAEY